MARSGPLLTEAQWKKIAPMLPKPPKQRKGGRPWIENRRVLEGILWILRSGARWQDLPEKYPHPSTCWRRLRDWDEQGVWLNIWRAFLSELNERQQLKWSESFLDGSFAPAKKGATEFGTTKRGKGTKWMVVVDGAGIPLGDHLHSASPAEVRLAETTLAAIRVGRRHCAGRPRQKPVRVIADKAYDSDPLRKRLRRRGIELICPHKRNRVRPAMQDGRALRRYRRRWIVERTIGWLGNFRRLVVRYDRSLRIYRAFFQIACFMIVLRRVVQ
ncbi:MAG TPA: IS5 family transposase [Terriglobales bacterium]|nr:IS5 family transposase [Terriglobales bacterium]